MLFVEELHFYWITAGQMFHLFSIRAQVSQLKLKQKLCKRNKLQTVTNKLQNHLPLRLNMFLIFIDV